MKVIRKGIFETNSSSVHTLCIARQLTNTDNIPEREDLKEYDDVIVVTPGEYGWSGPNVSSFLEKVRYLMTMILDYKYDFDEEKREFVPENMKLELLKNDPDWQNICAVVRTYRHKELLPVIPDGLNYYVDHQSCYAIEDFLDGLSLTEYLFNPCVFVEIDNDNH